MDVEKIWMTALDMLMVLILKLAVAMALFPSIIAFGLWLGRFEITKED